MPALVYAQYGYGTSSISLSSSSLSLYPGSSTSAKYSVDLSSGSTWGTTLQVVNVQQLSSSGISVSLSNAYGDPPFSGTVSISVSKNTKPGNYSIELQATGDDPSQATSINLVVLAPSSASSSSSSSTTPTTAPQGNLFKFISSSTLTVYSNESSIQKVGLSGPNGTSILVYILPGTYVKENGNLLSRYNFTVATFSSVKSYTLPNYTPVFAFAFEVNGNISSKIIFVNSTGSTKPVITFLSAPKNYTSYTLLNGTFNGTYYEGGSYAFKDQWFFNSTNNLLENNEFVKPVMWVVLSPVSKSAPSTSSTVTTLPVSSIPPSQKGQQPYALYAAIVVVVIIILAIAAFALRRK
ncbi:MAG: hypothetical protein QXL16_00195 [Candidatus Micrarchaeaceae archaeon]